MDSSELRAACEMAGLEAGSVTSPGFWLHNDEQHPRGSFFYAEHDPALPAYVAELLTAKVREQDPTAPYLAMALRDRNQWTEDPALATAEQRIEACMALLGGGA